MGGPGKTRPSTGNAVSGCDDPGTQAAAWMRYDARSGESRDMTNRTEWMTFAIFVVVVLAALGFLLRRGGVHGQSAALAAALAVILLLRIGFFAWNLWRQREEVEGR